jgi:hypothetical protein
MKNLRLFVVIIFLFSLMSFSAIDNFDRSQFTKIPLSEVSQDTPALTKSITRLTAGHFFFRAYLHKKELLAITLLLTTWFIYRRYRSTRRRRLNLNEDGECILGLAFDALSDLWHHRQALSNSKILLLTCDK